MPRGERPLAPGDSPLLRFAAELRLLRRKVGNPTYRELSALAHYSVASLSEAAAGRKLPSLQVTLAYVRACDGDVADWEDRWHGLAAELAATTEPVERDDGPAPYAGLAAFQPEDADRFFGREHLVETLHERTLLRRFVAVFGISGSGKSSVLRAGLVPRLGDRPVVVFTPGPHPPAEYRARIAAAGPEPVVVVDQFEEVFTLCRDHAERSAFIEELVRDADEEHGHVRVVLGVRADFYAHCARYPALVDVLRDGQLTLGPMSLDELRRAITLPAARAGYTLESSLLATLMAHADNQTSALPLLSHALLETWRRRHGKVLTLDGFRRAGGIDGALAQTAEQIHDSLGEHQRTLLRTLFRRLAVLGDGTEDTKRRIGRDELDTDDPNLAALLEQLTAARLVAVDRDRVEITHEALIRSWPRLRDWLAEDREALHTHRRLTEATKAWEAVGHDVGALYRGARLAVAVDLVTSRRIEPSGRERAFLDASSAAETAEHTLARRRTRRLRQLVGLLTVLLVSATASTVYAVHTQDTLEQQRNSVLSQRVAAQAGALRAANPALSAQLSLAAYRLSPTAEARGSLLSAFASPFATTLEHAEGATDVVFGGPDGHTLVTLAGDGGLRLTRVTDPHRPGTPTLLKGPVSHTMAVGAGGGLLAVAGDDGKVRLWDIADAPMAAATVDAHAGPVRAVAFNPAGTVLATGSDDHTVRLWDVSDRRNPVPLAVGTSHAEAVSAVAFSRDGRTLASGSRDHTVRLWDVTDPRRPGAPQVLTGHTSAVTNVEFGERTLASASHDRTARLWDVTDPARPGTSTALTGHNDIVRSVAFTPDGRTLATASNDRDVRLWRITGPASATPLMPLPGHTAQVLSARFSPDGRTLATAGDDHTVRLWDVPGPVLAGHTDSVYGVAYHPDGTVLATAGRDATVRLWDIRDPGRPEEIAKLTDHADIVRWAVFTPDGRTLATTSHDRTVRLWDVTDPRAPKPSAVIAAHNAPVILAAFSPDGRVLATTGEDRAARLWDVTDPTRPVPITALTTHTDVVTAVDISPDGRHLVTASRDRTVRLWDLGTLAAPRLIAVLGEHTDSVTSARFSPDGRLLATASVDRSARLWDLATPDRPVRIATLTGHADAVYSAVFSADGRTLVTNSADRTSRLWDIADPTRPVEHAVLTGHTDIVFQAAPHPRRNAMATIGHDRTTRLWELDVDQVTRHVCEVAHPTITRAEWQAYFPDLPYRPPCSDQR